MKKDDVISIVCLVLGVILISLVSDFPKDLALWKQAAFTLFGGVLVGAYSRIFILTKFGR
jgi:hypothetical protein